jgi:tRNA-2-methylthio-N6-dimethylallyladenosine synthase
MKYFIITYGCQMNRSDSERIAAVLEKIGYSPASNEKEADLIVINVCSVRQSAVDRLYGKISKIFKLKTQNHNSKPKIVLTGCLLPKDKEKLKNQVDLIFNINQLINLPKMLSKLENKKFKNLKSKIKNYLEIVPKFSTYPLAYVPIMTGCNNFCSYCVVPYTRGREISRPAKEILCEIRRLLKDGYKMIILLGQNVNSYKSQKNSKDRLITFPKLLKMINNLKGNFWLTFITSHPKDLSDELIETMAKCKKVMSYLHLPVQSGDDEILKKMNRHYTVAHYKELIRKVRSQFFCFRKGIEKNITISTDIIVGFPTETRKQFENTAKLMKEIKFDMAYIAKYSPRSGTMAEKLKDDVSVKEKERRWKILADILKKTALENNKKYLGKIVEVLIQNRKDQNFLGQTKTFKNVKIKIKKGLEKKKPGDFVKVKIKEVIPWGLKA